MNAIQSPPQPERIMDYSTAKRPHAKLFAVVANRSPQRNVELRLLNSEGWNPVGNVAIPPTHPVPIIGAVVEVRYLHALRQNRVLHQPTYLRERQDIELHECVLSQLKYKPEGV